MSNVEGPTSIILVRGPLNGAETIAEPLSKEECIHYLRSRERAETLAATRAQTEHARRTHQALADHYSRKIRQRES